MTLLQLTPAMATHRGMRRRHNEDSVGYEYPTDLSKLQSYGALFVVADGVGGLSAGEQASQMAVEKLIEYYYNASPLISAEQRLALAFQRTNADVFRILKREAATTMVAIAIIDNQLIAASVGDSLIYRIRGDKIDQLNEEDVVHSDDDQNGALTKAIGYREELELETIRGTLQSNDRILLCSDGITRYLKPEQLLRLSELRDPRDSVRRMLNEANAAGGADNVTALLVLVGAEISEAEIAKFQEKISVRVAVDTDPMIKLDVDSKPHTQLPMSRPEPVVPESIIESPEFPQRPVPQSTPSVTTSAPKSKSAGGMNWLVIAGLAVLVLGSIIIGGGLVLLGNQNTNSVSPTAPPPDNTEAVTAEQSASESGENLGTAQVGDTITLSSSILTLVRVDNADLAAFVATPETPYLIDEIFEDSEGQLWYRLLDQESEQSGWVLEADLPNYQLQQN
jgi:protein phosphatase